MPVMRDDRFNRRVMSGISGAQLPRVKPEYFFNLTLPDIPPDEQDQIVTSLEVEQELINSNKKLINHYTQKIRSTIIEIWGE